MHGDDTQCENENGGQHVDEEDLNGANDLVGFRKEEKTIVDFRRDNGDTEWSDERHEKDAENDDPCLSTVETRPNEERFRYG